MKAPGSLAKMRNKHRLPGVFQRKNLGCGKKKKKNLEKLNSPSTLINQTWITTEIYASFVPLTLALAMGGWHRAVGSLYEEPNFPGSHPNPVLPSSVPPPAPAAVGKTCTFLRVGLFCFNMFFGTPGSLIIASGSEGGFCKGSLSSCMSGEITIFLCFKYV